MRKSPRCRGGCGEPRAHNGDALRHLEVVSEDLEKIERRGRHQCFPGSVFRPLYMTLWAALALMGVCSFCGEAAIGALASLKLRGVPVEVRP